MGLRTSQKKGNKSTGWIRDTVLRIYTEDQVKEDWNAIDPVDRIKVAASWVPKEMKVDNSSTFRLVIEGLQNKVIDSSVIESKALDEHQDDANDDDPQ